MQFKIENMILILNNGKKRALKFHDGVNIISGKSQTGKSALIDIIDYCLFSSSCTIPQGIIIKNVQTYCIVVWINDKKLILARNTFFSSENPGSNKIYIEEISELFKNKLICKKYFDDNKDNFISENIFKKYIKRLLNITTKKIALDDIEDSVLSFRSMTSFMFQDQNLMASKHTLFYRLDSFKKVKQTQRDLKVYLNIQDINLLQIDQELYEIERELKQIKKDEKFINKKFNMLITKLKNDCITYYALYGNSEEKILTISELNTNDILNFKNIVEDITKNELDSNIPKELSKIEEKKDKEFDKINKIIMQLEDIKNYEDDIKSTNDILDTNIDIPKEQTCPLCSSKDHYNYNKYIEAKEKIKKESLQLKAFEPQIYEEKEHLEEELKNTKNTFKQLNSEFKNLQEKYNNITKTQDKKEELLKLKTKILSTQDFLKELKKHQNKGKEELLTKQQKLLKQKGNFNISTKIKQIEVKISEYINEVINNGLFLEDSLGKANLYFDIEDFSLYQQVNNKKIYLTEMGSGSNWLNCHIALTLGIHKYVSLNETKIPSFLFYDQPSQVYFPSENDIKNNNEQSDLETVKNIFKKIITNVDLINNNKKCISKLQLFITDHVYFQEDWFTKHLIDDGIWDKDHKLIPKL